MSTCSGHPPLAEGRKALQVREPSEGAPSSTTQGTWITQIKKISYEQANNTQNSTKGTREQKGSRGQLALGEQPREGSFNKGLRVGRSPGDGKLPRTSPL